MIQAEYITDLSFSSYYHIEYDDDGMDLVSITRGDDNDGNITQYTNRGYYTGMDDSGLSFIWISDDEKVVKLDLSTGLSPKLDEIISHLSNIKKYKDINIYLTYVLL